MRRIVEIVFGLVVIVACVRFLVGGGGKSRSRITVEPIQEHLHCVVCGTRQWLADATLGDRRWCDVCRQPTPSGAGKSARPATDGEA